MSTRAPVWLPRPVGVDRPDDPILTMTAEQKKLFLEVVWYASYLSGYGSPVERACKERCYAPRTGDLVIIPDALRRIDSEAGSSQLMGVGYLTAERTEPAISEEAWAEYGQSDWEGRCPEQRIWYVQYMPAAGDVCRWENAGCQAVPRGGEFADEVHRIADRIMKEQAVR